MLAVMSPELYRVFVVQAMLVMVSTSTSFRVLGTWFEPEAKSPHPVTVDCLESSLVPGFGRQAGIIELESVIIAKS